MFGLVQRHFAMCMGVVFLGMMTSLPGLVTSDKDYYHGRVRVYVDKAGVDKFQYDYPGRNLTKHVETMFERVNEIYTSLLPALNVTLQMESVVPLGKNIFKNILWTKGSLAIYYDWTGYEFWKWTRKTYDPKAYDFAVLLTGFDMYSRMGYSGAFGHGYEGSACTENGVGAVEIQEPQGTVGLAHEIGHILGAAHDEEGPKRLCGPGTYQYGNLMNKYTKFDNPLRFKFSQCSIRQISEYFSNMTKSGDNCLLVMTDKNDTIPALQTTADEVCEQHKGQGWSLSRQYRGHGDQMCDDFTCVAFQDGDRKFASFEAPEGLKCTQSKRCYRRKCVYVTNGDPDASDSCPWGSQLDSYVKQVYGRKCSELGCGGYSKMCCGDCKSSGN